jgi:chromosome partitioning protein
VSTEITIHRASTQKEIFRSVFELRDQTDLLIADGPGGIAEQTRPLLLVSDLTVVPCGPSKLDLEATLITLDMIEECRMVRKDGYPHAVFVPNRIQQHMHLSQELMRASTRLEVPVTETYLRYLQVYARAPGLGQVVWDIPNAPSDAAGDMQLLCREILTYAETHQSA